MEVIVTSANGFDGDSFLSCIRAYVPDYFRFYSRVEKRLSVLGGPDEVDPDAGVGHARI